MLIIANKNNNNKYKIISYSEIKKGFLFLSEEDDWFYILHNKTRTYELIQSDTKSLHNMIDKKYLNQSKSGFENYTNYYKIGPVQNFIS